MRYPHRGLSANIRTGAAVKKKARQSRIYCHAFRKRKQQRHKSWYLTDGPKLRHRCLEGNEDKEGIRHRNTSK